MSEKTTVCRPEIAGHVVLNAIRQPLIEAVEDVTRLIEESMCKVLAAAMAKEEAAMKALAEFGCVDVGGRGWMIRSPVFSELQTREMCRLLLHWGRGERLRHSTRF